MAPAGALDLRGAAPRRLSVSGSARPRRHVLRSERKRAEAPTTLFGGSVPQKPYHGHDFTWLGTKAPIFCDFGASPSQRKFSTRPIPLWQRRAGAHHLIHCW